MRVTRHASWLALRFGVSEQGLAYIGYDGEPGWRGGAAIPSVLPFEYLRVMATAAVGMTAVNQSAASGAVDAARQRRRVLCVGLGAGMLPSFWAWHDREAAVRVVEIEPTVISIARDVLGLEFEEAASVAELLLAPRERAPLLVARGDAGACMAAAAKSPASNRQDLIFLDAFDEDGIPKHLRAPSFIKDCGLALSDSGVLCCNLWNGTHGSAERRRIASYVAALERWVGPVYSFQVRRQPTNVILVACKRGSPAAAQRVSSAAVREAVRRLTTDWEFSTDELVTMFGASVKMGILFEEDTEAVQGPPFWPWKVSPSGSVQPRHARTERSYIADAPSSGKSAHGNEAVVAGESTSS